MGIIFKKDESTLPSHEELQKMKAQTEFEGPIPTLQTEELTKAHNIIWDLSTQLGEAKHKLKMVELQLSEIKRILNE